MSINRNSSPEDNPNTYVVYDSKKKAELQRLILQERIVTTATGGVLSEQTDPGSFQSVLDIGCGPGGWLLSVAQNYPATKLIGIDINKQMTDYAQSQAQTQGLTDRVEFQIMDALNGLAFAENSFDLVNVRFAMSYVRTWDWPKLLLEMQRVSRPGGVIRVTEAEMGTQSNSSALTQYFEMMIRAMYRGGYLFTEDRAGLTNHLADLLTKSWCENVQTKAYPAEFRAGMPGAQSSYEDLKTVIQTTRPFIQKWVGITGDYDAMYRQACKEMEHPNFQSTGYYVTVWGSKPLMHAK